MENYLKSATFSFYKYSNKLEIFKNNMFNLIIVFSLNSYLNLQTFITNIITSVSSLYGETVGDALVRYVNMWLYLFKKTTNCESVEEFGNFSILFLKKNYKTLYESSHFIINSAMDDLSKNLSM